MAKYLIKYLDGISAIQNALRDVNAQRFMVDSAEYKSEEELTKLTNITSKLGATPVSGGGNRVDEALVEGISRRQMIDENRREAQGTLDELDYYMSYLTEEERFILRVSYIEAEETPNWLAIVEDKLHIEQAEVYRKRNAAVRHLATLAYGSGCYGANRKKKENR